MKILKDTLKQIIPYIIGIIISLSLSFQWYHYQKFEADMKRFTSVGPRFTFDQGQVLCERIKMLEENQRVTGFKIPELDCKTIRK